MRSCAEVRPHIVRHQPAFRFAGATALCKLIHQFQGCLRFLIVLHIHDGVPSAPVLRQKDRGAHSHIMQYLAVISQVRNGFNIRHIYQLFSNIAYPILL